MNVLATVARIMAAALLAAVTGTVSAQQAYPNKPIRFLTANASGGSTSILARLIGEKMTERWGQPVIVDDRPGGNGFIGGDALAKSPPDGYAIIIVTSTHIITPLLARAPYDTVKDFSPVATVASAEQLMVIHPSVAANNLQEFIALAKSKPGQINYTTTGTGGFQHLSGELFGLLTGTKMQPIPYKGGAPALSDLIGGHVQVSIQSPFVVIPHVKSGRVKAIAITGDARLSALPQTPTFAEAGLPSFDVKNWYGILAPAGTPAAIIDRLSTEVARFLATPEVKKSLVEQGMDPFTSTPEQFAALMKADIDKFSKVIKAANVKME